MLAAIQLEAVASAEGHLANPKDAHEIAYKAAGMAASDEWCGFFAMENYMQSNLDADLKRGFFHVINVEDYFTYHYAFGERKDTRVMKWIYADGAWQDLHDYHAKRGSVRQWLTADELGDNPDIRPGDLVLIDNRGTPAADHIVMAHSYDMATNTLFTIGGNDGGYEVDTGAHHTTPHGAEKLEGATGQSLRSPQSGYRVGVNEIDLNRNRQPLRVYGIGRPSIVDFEEHRYDSTSEKHPPNAK
jgi:hypothetical protein